MVFAASRVMCPVQLGAQLRLANEGTDGNSLPPYRANRTIPTCPMPSLFNIDALQNDLLRVGVGRVEDFDNLQLCPFRHSAGGRLDEMLT